MKKTRIPLFSWFGLLFLLVTAQATAQFRVMTSPPLNGGNGSSTATFNLQAYADIFVDTLWVPLYGTSTTAQTVEIWTNPTAIAAAPGTNGIAAPAWTQRVVQPGNLPLNASNSGPFQFTPIVIPGGLLMTAGSHWGFAVGGTGVSIAYTNLVAGNLDTFAAPGFVTLRNGANIGFGGTWPSPTIASRQFTGGISFRPASGRDLRVSALVSPSLPVTGGATTPLTINLGNAAADPITSAVVGYQLDNGPVVTENWTGNLGVGQSANHTFSSPLTLPSQGNFTLRVFCGNANGLGNDNNTSNDTLVRNFCPGLSGILNVGPNGAYADIPSAMAALTNCGANGPIILSLEPGIYTGTSTIINYPGSVHGLTVRSSTGNRNDVFLSNNGVGHTLSLQSARNVTIENLTVRMYLPATAPTAQMSALNIDNGSGISVVSCNFIADSLSTSTFNRNISVINCNNLLIQGCSIREGYYGIYHTGANSPAYATNNRFLNNTILNQYFYGVYLLRMGGVEFKGNRILSTRTGTTGTTSSYALRIDNTKGMDVSGNSITGTFGAYGTYFSNCQMDTANNRPNRFYNNALSIDFTNSTAPRALFLALSTTDGLDAMDIAHNSLDIRSALTSTTAAGVVTVSGSTATTVTNTLAYLGFHNNSIELTRSSGTATGTALMYYLGHGVVNSTTANHNLYYFNNQLTGVLFKQWVSSSVTNSLDLPTWRTNTGKDLNSLVGDPLYTSTTNLMPLAISPLRNAGMTLAWISTDLNGTPRDANPDIGAYEVVLAAADIAALSMVSPAQRQLVPGQTYPLSFRFQNTGGTAVTSAVLYYQIGNDPPVSASFNAGSNPLAPGDSVLVTFSGPGFTAPLVGTLLVKVWTSLPNGVADGNPGNDTLSTTYCIGLSGTILVGNVPAAQFPDLASALVVVNSCGISGPTTLSLAPGTYSGNFLVANYAGSVNGLTITSSTGLAADVVLSNTGNGNAFTLNGASNLTFYAVTISNPLMATTGATASACIEMNGCNNITVSNCVLRGDPTSTSSNNRTLYLSNSSQIIVTGNTISNSYYGIYVTATSPDYASNLQVTGNQLSNLYYYGFYFNRCQNLQVVANKVTGAGTTYYGYYAANSMGMVFRENELYGNMNFYGYYFSNLSGSPSMPNRLINNVVSCDFSATTPRALYLTASTTDGLDYLELHHNSFEARVNSTSTTANGLVYITGGSATAPAMSRLLMQNNIFRLVRSGGTFSATGLYYFAGTYLIDSTLSNYNLFHFEGQGTSPLFRMSATNYDLAGWRTAFAEDLQSLNADPLFNSTTSLIPLSLSAARNAGTPSFVTTDLAGNLRDANPDLGAYEIQIGAADVFMEAILNPPAVVQPSTSYPVTARILNVSLNPLVSVRLHYRYGTQPEVTQVFSLALQPGDSVDLTFTQNLVTAANGTNSLTVWSDLPNGINDANPGNDTTRMLLCLPLPGGTYTVGGNPGAHFATFAELFEILGCGGVSGPVRIELDAVNNLHNEQVIIPAIPGLSASNPLVLMGMGDTLIASTSTRSLAVLGFNRTRHIEVRNFFIKTQGNTTGVLFANSDSCSLVNNTILADTALTSSTVNGIVTSGALNSTSSASLSMMLSIDSNTVVGGYYGLRMYGDANTYASGNKVRHNVFRDFYFYGIYSYYQDHAQIKGNDLSRPDRRTLTTFYGIYNLYFLRGEISGNRIHNPFGTNPLGTSSFYGLYIGSSPSPANEPTLVYNNIIHNINNGTGSLYGLYNSGSSNTHWYHNTAIYDQAASTAGLVYGAYFLGTGLNNVFKNNLISISRGGTGTKYCIYYVGTSGMISDNNNLHMGSTTGTNGIGYNVTGRTTLADWQNASGGLFDMNSSSADPAFASPASLPLLPTNWQMNNIGDNLGNLVTQDFAGATRSITPDPGAYEYTVNGCFGIVNLRSDQVQAYSARLLWASAASQWELEYGLAGFAQGTGTTLSLGQSSTTLSGLLPNTAYQVYVRESGCTGGPGSWFTGGFTTKRDYDLSAVDLIAPVAGSCTNNPAPVRMVVANTGILPVTGYTGRVRVSGPTNATVTAVSTNTLAPGQKDTLLVGNLNLFPGRLASFEISVSNSLDVFRFNDTLDIDKEFIGISAGQDTTITPGDTATLNASVFGFSSSSVLPAATGANNGSSGISFNVRALQTAYLDTIYTNIYGTLGNPCTVSLWYIPSAINGTPNISTAGGWTQVHSAYATTVGNSAFNNALANTAIPLPAGFNIPAGSTYGFFLQVTGGSTAYKTWATGTVDTFANNAIVIYTGNNIGYGGAAPNPVNHPRQFCGSVSIRNRAVVEWTELGSSTVLATGNTLRVAPSVTTSYVATLVDSLCPSSDAVTVFSGSQNEIVGVFRYNNTAQTPMTNSVVQLKDPQNVVVLTANTDANGGFVLSPVSPGTYTLTGTTNKPWGGVSAVDALSISRSFTGAAPLTGLRLKAADVNGSNTVSSLDALTTSRRFSGSVASFTVGNWAMENLPVTFSSGTITRNLLGICYGDVNGSYNPNTALRTAPKIHILTDGIQTVASTGTVNRWVWSTNRSVTLGALSLVLTFPEGVLVKEVHSAMDNGNFDYHQNGRELRISWYSLEENQREPGEPLFSMDLTGLPENGLDPASIGVEELSEAASPLAEVYDMTTLRVPALSAASVAECVLFPNPTQGHSTLRLNNREAGRCEVRVMDARGRILYSADPTELMQGFNEIPVSLEGLEDGLYTVQVVVTPQLSSPAQGGYSRLIPLNLRR